MIEFYVTGQNMKTFSPVIAADSINYLTAKFNFNGDEWDDYTKTAHFRKQDTSPAIVYDISLNEDDEITADDHLNLTSGYWDVYLTGVLDDARLTTVVNIITVKESGLIDAPLHEMPLSIAEQIDSKASTALLMATAVKDAADRGDFDGAPGAAGPAGEPGPQGPQGVQGPAGATGPQGPQGIQGPKGDTGATGSQGPRGETGAGFKVIGYFETVAELIAGVPHPAEGDAYGVGSSEPYDIYIWDAVNNEWKDNGPLQGAKGDDGVTFTPSVDESGNLSWTNDGGKENPETVNIRGPQGLKGDTGDTGPQGIQGIQGPAGAQGATGSPGADGTNGADGVTFTPSVDASGNVSWTNDGGRENPDPVNIMGPSGSPGSTGPAGKSAYQAATEGGYTGTESTFNNAMSSFPYHNARHLPDGADPILVKTGNVEDLAITRQKLGANAVSNTYTATLNTTWSGSAAPYTKAQTINGILAADYPIVDLVPSETYSDAKEQEDAWSSIFRIVASANTLTFYAHEKPSVSLPIKVICIRK